MMSAFLFCKNLPYTHDRGQMVNYDFLFDIKKIL